MLEDCATILRVLARSATGQSSPPTRPSPPAATAGRSGLTRRGHVILLDNGRSSMLGTEFWTRCAASAVGPACTAVYHAAVTLRWVIQGRWGGTDTVADRSRKQVISQRPPLRAL